MSNWSTIQEGVVQILRGLESTGAALFSTVKARPSEERKALRSSLCREPMPAAYVCIEGRSKRSTGPGSAGVPLFKVLLADRSERRAAEAQTGGTENEGTFGLAEAAASAIHNGVLAGEWRLALVEEKTWSEDEAVNLWEQRYEVRCDRGAGQPTFGGVTLTGSGSQVWVEVGSLQRAISRFSFPGVDGVFERDSGLRDRPIVWWGQLRAADDAGLNAIEASIEDSLVKGEAKTLDDGRGNEYSSCVLHHFERKGARGRDGLTGQMIQEMRIEFHQLSP